MNRYAISRNHAFDSRLDLQPYPSWAHGLMRQIYPRLDQAGLLGAPLELAMPEGESPGRAAAGDEDMLQPAYGKGRGGNDNNERCFLMLGSREAGLCIYLCPGGDVVRLDSPGALGCQPWIFRHQGAQPWERGPGPEGPRRPRPRK